jgi:uncharacterized membrane protein YbhN (UPF0104 family)
MSDIAAYSSSKRATRIVAWSLCGVILLFVGVALFKQFKQVDWSRVRFRPIPCAAAVLCTLGVSGMQLIARWTLLRAYNYLLGWRTQLSAAWVPQLGKYIPGGIASVGGTVYLLRKAGVAGAVALSVAVLLDALAVMAGLIISIPLLLTDRVRAAMPTAWLAGAVMIALGFVMLHPRVFVTALNFALVKFHRQPIAQIPPVQRYLWPVLASFGQWLLAGLGLWCMTLTVTDVSANQIPLFIASAALAMTVSYLMPFAPGGLGVREGIYVITLRAAVGPEIAIVALAMRVIQTVVEVVLAGVGFMVMRRDTTKTN